MALLSNTLVSQQALAVWAVNNNVYLWCSPYDEGRWLLPFTFFLRERSITKLKHKDFTHSNTKYTNNSSILKVNSQANRKATVEI